MSINPYFMFATGIENSYPTIANGSHRVDEMAKCGHYDRWRDDFDLVEEMGIHFLRYGPPLHTTWLSEGRYDWRFADATFADLKRRDIVPIVDLCHFGVPDWIGNFQNPEIGRQATSSGHHHSDRTRPKEALRSRQMRFIVRQCDAHRNAPAPF